jgi:hypothetical protein
MHKQLYEIKELAQANQISQAQTKLEKYLEDSPADAEGWFLASFVQPTPDMRLSAIRRAAKLMPDQPDIQKHLMKLESAARKKQKFPWLPALAIGTVALLVVLTLAVASLNLHTAPVSNELPTLAVLQVVTDLPSQPIAALDSQNGTMPTAVAPVLQPTLEAPDSGSSAQPTEVAQTVLVSPIAPTPALAVSQSPIAPTLVLAVPQSPGAPTPVFTASQADNPLPLPTATPAAFITPTLASNNPTTPPVTIIPTQPTVAHPTPMPTPMQTVPLDAAINILPGQFRVVDATRGAESMIQSLGGSFAPAPASQSWLLVELLLICNDNAACTFDPSTLKITGSSGSVYAYSPQLNLSPTFGKMTKNNQIWGYLGFIIPTSETRLELTLSENGQTYAVTLE